MQNIEIAWNNCVKFKFVIFIGNALKVKVLNLKIRRVPKMYLFLI